LKFVRIWWEADQILTEFSATAEDGYTLDDMDDDSDKRRDDKREAKTVQYVQEA
jgi:hypothetical protein